MALTRARQRRRSTIPRGRGVCVLVAATLLVLSGCGSAQSQNAGSDASTPSSDTSQRTAAGPDRSEQDSASTEAPESARVGASAASERLRFKPTSLELPGGADAPVEPARTVNRELVIPENVDQLGWWDGGAYVNDPFGSAVIAGHIDSAEQGVGFFGQLLTMDVGDEVVVRGKGGELTYAVTETELVNKDVLVADTVAFDQSGEHRLVLITCSGRWRPEVHSYESNFIVVAEPVGLAEPTP